MAVRKICQYPDCGVIIENAKNSSRYCKTHSVMKYKDDNRNAVKRHYQKKSAIRKSVEKKCVDCNVVITNRTRCPECAKKRQREQVYAWQKAHSKEIAENRKVTEEDCAFDTDLVACVYPPANLDWLDRFKGIDGYNYGKQVAAMRGG